MSKSKTALYSDAYKSARLAKVRRFVGKGAKQGRQMCEDWSVKVQSGRQMCEAVAESAKWYVKGRSGCQTCESGLCRGSARLGSRGSGCQRCEMVGKGAKLGAIVRTRR